MVSASERTSAQSHDKPLPSHDGTTQPACRLLIADDEEDLRSLLAILFGDLGWQVDEAIDGREAWDKLKNHSYDLVLLDHRMPGLNGGEVYDRLRSAGIRVPVVLLTAAKQVDEIAARHGISMFLGKPFTIEDLLHLIEQYSPRS